MNVKKYSWIWPYLLITPALTVVICVVFIPVIEAVITSLKYHDLRYPDRTAWVGLQNYADLLTADAQFWPAGPSCGSYLAWGFSSFWGSCWPWC